MENMTKEMGLIKPTAAVESLDDYELASVDLNFEYWTPTAGDVKRVLYKGVQPRSVPDHADPEKLVDLPCVVFQDPADSRVYVNGSAILRSTCEILPEDMPVQVSYLGKKRSRSGNQCDNWGVQTLAKKGSK
jgi:hypothetical protein